MTGGFTTDTGLYKVGSAFVAYKTRIAGDDESYGWYSYELAGWVKEADVSGESTTAKFVKTGAKFYSESGFTTELGTVTARNFVTVAISATDGGTCTAVTLYGGRFVVVGSTVVFTAAANTGFKELSFTVNGAASTKSVLVGDLDIVAVATFCPTSYGVRNDGVSGSGSSTVSVGSTPVGEGQSVPAGVGAVVSVSATPATGNAFAYAEIDGRRIASNPATFTIADRAGSAVIPVRTVFSAVAVIRDTIVVGANGSAVVTLDGSVVTRDADGKFTATLGGVYTVTAMPNSGYRIEGFYENGRKVASGSSYVFVQDEAPRMITIAFAEAETIAVYVYSGGDISSSAEEWNGCTCAVERPSGTGIGTYTFTPSAADGYHFVRLYIEDTDETGKGRVIPAGQSLAVYIDFSSRVVAIFAADDAPDEPEDEDQGNATHTTATLNAWEGSEARMTARWRSRRNVFTKPVSMSAARVCANGYGSNGPVITIAAYESPNTKDGMEVSIPVDNQDAFRLPKERPEKYVEVEVASDSRVLELAVATSMEGLWQASS